MARFNAYFRVLVQAKRNLFIFIVLITMEF
jgi:hypothetical protein